MIFLMSSFFLLLIKGHRAAKTNLIVSICQFQEGTTHLVWSFGKGPLYELEGLDLTDPDSSSANGKRSGHSSQPLSILNNFTNKKTKHHKPTK